MPDPTAVWEAPELVARLTVGTRVRVTLRGECSDRCSWCGWLRHEIIQSGDVGTIFEVREEDADDLLHNTNSAHAPLCFGRFPRAGHRFGVKIDRLSTPTYNRGGWFAAIELSPVEE